MNPTEPAKSDTRTTGSQVLGHLLLTVFCLALAVFFRAKLSNDDLVRAAIADPASGQVTRRAVTITRKWKTEKLRPGDSVWLSDPETTYWVSWSTTEAWGDLSTRMNLSPQAWEKAQIGGHLKVITVAGDKTLRAQNDIALSEGSALLDRVLLWVFGAVGGVALLFLPLSILAWRNPKLLEDEPRSEPPGANP